MNIHHISHHWRSGIVATPLWGKCEDEIHIPKSGNLESSGTLTTSELDCRAQNTLSWSVLYTIGKALKCTCWNGLAWAIWTFAAQVMVERRARSQIAVWLSTTKSRELTRPRCVQIECDTSLERSWGELQNFFRPHPNLRSEPRVMSSQSPESPNRDNFETISGFLLGSLGNKSYLDAGATEQRREYYMGEGDGFPWVWVVVSQVSPRLPVACPNTKKM